MIERTPLLIVAGLAALTVAACGDHGAAPGVGGATGMASEEPIDAVPLPLDDNPLSPPPVVVPVAAPVKTADAEAPTVTDPAASTTEPAAAPVVTLEAPAKPPKVVVAPREPSRPAERPGDRPAPPAAQDREPEKPVLNF